MLEDIYVGLSLLCLYIGYKFGENNAGIIFISKMNYQELKLLNADMSNNKIN